MFLLYELAVIVCKSHLLGVKKRVQYPTLVAMYRWYSPLSFVNTLILVSNRKGLAGVILWSSLRSTNACCHERQTIGQAKTSSRSKHPKTKSRMSNGRDSYGGGVLSQLSAIWDFHNLLLLEHPITNRKKLKHVVTRTLINNTIWFQQR